MRVHAVGLTITSIILMLPPAVLGQTWLSDRENKEGPGIKVGESLVLHLGIGLEGGFDSNATLSSDNIKAGRLRITPYVDLATRSPQRLNDEQSPAQLTPPKVIFRAGLATWYDRYFAKDSGDVARFNSRFNPFGFDVHANLTVLPERKVSFLGSLIYVKTMEPYETASDTQDRHQVSPGLGLRIRPGGGMLEIEPRYQLSLLHFSDDAIAARSDRMEHAVSVGTNWKFLPKTAMVSNVTFAPHLYYGSGSANQNSLPVRSWFGLQSLILNKFGIRALAGYGASFYSAGPDFDGLLLDGSLLFYLNPFSKITIGGQKDFVDSFYANYYEQIGGYLGYDQMFGGRLLLTLKGSASYRKYAAFDGSEADPTIGSSSTPNTLNRRDVWVSVTTLLEFRASDWLSFHASFRLWADVTDFTVEHTSVDDAGATQTLDVPSEFVKFEVFAGARFHY